MTTDLEKQFFDTFGIEAKEAIFCGYDGACPFNYPCDECPYFLNNKGSYPQVTNRILLELICITKGLVITEDCNSVEQLKDGVLKVLINLAQVNNDIKHQVRTLFEEG